MEENKNSIPDIVPVVSKITKHKLNGSNYIEWSKTIKFYLRSVAKDDHLTEEPPNDNTRKLWMQDDARLFLQIKNSINSDIVGLLSHCEFVKELMDYLDFLYFGKGNVSRMYDVWNAFHCPENGAKSLTAYFMDFKKVYEELNALMSFSPDVRVQQAQREQMEVFSRVLRTENVPSSQHTNVLAAKEGNAENARRVNNKGGNRAFENRGNDSSTIVRFYCHEAGHAKKNYKKLQNRNRRNQTANVATSDTATSSDSLDKIVTMTAEEFAKYSQYQEALKASTPVSALAKLGKTCLVSSSNKWIIDLGATDHMTGNHKTFSTFRTHSAPPITVIDGSTYEIKGSGTVKPTSSITLFSDLMTKRTFGKGRVSDGLYILDEWVPRPVVCVSTTSPVEAHYTRPSVTKLDPKALKCVFLGYSRLQKGYRCFLTDLNKYLVSTDVVFSKDTSFFSSPTSSASEEEDEEWLVYQVVNSRPTVGQSSMVDSDASLAHFDTCPAPAPSSSDPSSDLDLPISLRKVNPDGSVTRLKVRLVARGYAQTYGVDYSDTCFPVAKLNSVRLFISITASQQWMIHQLDIKNVFLHGDLKEEVYMEQPPGFVAQGVYGKVCCLEKALYGLKQSPRAWFGKFSKEIQAFGMNKSKKDHFVFYKKSTAGIILLVVYVNDIVITRNDHAGISDLKAFMHSKSHTKDLGELKYFLGIEVSRSKKGMFLSQRKYVLDLLEETGKIEAKPCTTPMVPNVQLMPNDGDPFYNPERYRRVVGKLNYLTVTRPDIAYAVSVVSQFTSAPTIKHWAALEQILCYLKTAPSLSILYSTQGHTRIECFSDAD
ncbi:Retrovirus-related Pol polyprotein from transposon RE1 [Vitis vinifera]|uniref:Retrovirus-related Pol polyprotein from transposon RE1 n=1 Tax=Vitis vinifera TaxID=29760 RepID=A0A438F143_VITVI|nr:Retrovirus-related Pol polyprotein from transposon RE1 [Vitis vinifera]